MLSKLENYLTVPPKDTLQLRSRGVSSYYDMPAACTYRSKSASSTPRFLCSTYAIRILEHLIARVVNLDNTNN